MANPHRISIANDFSAFPAGRFRRDGVFNGERFRDEILIPNLRKFGKLIINLDGVAGLPSSFLEEVFGGMVRRHLASFRDLQSTITLETSEPDMKVYIPIAWSYAREAERNAT